MSLIEFIEKSDSNSLYIEKKKGIEIVMDWNIILGHQAICMMSGAMEEECDELIYPFQPIFYDEIEEWLNIEICTSKSQNSTN